MFRMSQAHEENVPTTTLIKNETYQEPFVNQYRPKQNYLQNQQYLDEQVQNKFEPVNMQNQDYHQFYSREHLQNNQSAPVYPPLYVAPYSPQLNSYHTPMVTPNQANFPNDPFRQSVGVGKDNEAQGYGKRLRMQSMDFHNQLHKWEPQNYRGHEHPQHSECRSNEMYESNHPIHNAQKQPNMQWHNEQEFQQNQNFNQFQPRFVDNSMQQFYSNSIPPEQHQQDYNHFEANKPNPNYFFDPSDFQMVNQQQSEDGFNMMYENKMSSFDSNLMKNMVLPNQQLIPMHVERKRIDDDLHSVLPTVVTGPRPYSPALSHRTSQSNVIHKLPFITSSNEPLDKAVPLCSTQPIRIPSHLLLTFEQRKMMETKSVVKRTFDLDDAVTSQNFLLHHGLLLEQLGKPMSKWKTRNTRKRKNAVTHLYQCCCGSDVKQFHGTKGTRRSKQKFPFVGCTAFVEVARRVSDNRLIWVRGLLDHSQLCNDAKPFVNTNQNVSTNPQIPQSSNQQPLPTSAN